MLNPRGKRDLIQAFVNRVIPFHGRHVALKAVFEDALDLHSLAPWPIEFKVLEREQFQTKSHFREYPQHELCAF